MKIGRPFIKLCTLYFILLALFGCGINSRTSYIINPDLSGKCVFEEKVGLDVAMITTVYGNGSSSEKELSGFSSLFGTDTVMPAPHEILLGFASKILSNKSVEAWKDVDFHLIGNDTAYFKGTAYFKNVSTGGLASIDTSMNIYTNDQGQTVIEMKQPKTDSANSYTSKVYKNLFKGGLYYSMIHYCMASIMRDYYMSVSYQVPGKIITSNNFVKKNDHTAELTMNGKNMIHFLDTLMGNTDLMSKMYSNPASLTSFSSSNQYSANKYLFGEAKPVRLVYLSNGKAQFDYAKEVADAKIYYTKFRKKSGLDAYDSIAAAKKEMEDAEKKKEEGTLVLTTFDSAGGKIYFKNLSGTQYYRGYVSFSGEVSKPVSSSSFTSVSLLSVITDNGTDILDSITNHDNISAYMTNPDVSYSYSADTSISTETKNYKVSFSINGTFPDDCKYINIKGLLKVNDETVVPFNIVNLNLIKKSYGEGYK